MFLRTKINKSIKNFSSNIDILREKIETSDAILIGAGAGLSTAAGFTYSGKRFDKYFSDFKNKYGIKDMYSGGFYPYAALEEYWAYWSRYIYINRYMNAPKPVYESLLSLIKDKDYFVLTTNVDHCFQKAGFDKKKLFYTQGDYGLFQCSKPCHNKTYDNEKIVSKMFSEQRDMKVPEDLIPKCPVCGAPMTMNLRCDDTFVQDDGWYKAAERYNDFVRRHEKVQILFLELGTGFNTPGIIKFPFWKMTKNFENAFYACINLGEAYAPNDIDNKSICINSDIGKVLEYLIQTQNSGLSPKKRAGKRKD